MIRLASPSISETIAQEVLSTLSSGRWVQGQRVVEFEQAFADYIDTKHAIAVSNGTAALHTALLAANIKPGDEIITTPFSFVASSNTILMCGAKPIFVDINPKTFNIDSELIEAAITSKTRAILPVHLYGQPCEIEKIKSICSDHSLKLVEDSCQAHGAEYNNKKVGGFGDSGCFSFYATKNLACGEGGMIVTNNDELARKARLLRSHGEAQRYNSTMLGYNYRMTEISAVIGLGNLKYLDSWNKKRIENANLLTSLLKNTAGIVTPRIDSNITHVFHQYTIRVLPDYSLSRDQLARKLAEQDIESRVFYPIPLNRMEHIMKIAGDVSCPVAEQACKEVLSLPIHPGVSQDDIKRTAETLF